MNQAYWMDVISRITQNAPLELDTDELRQQDTPDAEALEVVRRKQAYLPASIFPQRDGETMSLGIRVTEPVADIATVGLHLATLACERNVIPIIISTVDVSGFEQFGFRVERVSGSDAAEAEAQEEELKRFWNLVIVVDIESVTLMA
ncbi:hypothetical protein HKCCE3408_15125 [Rhodobacterales bacterium HKCCE3408]|nr:hypothetical protein [Rhodobacterales bacterium HKCCE3408]